MGQKPQSQVGRPHKRGETYDVPVTIKLSPSLVDKLNHRKDVSGVPISTQIRNAIEGVVDERYVDLEEFNKDDVAKRLFSDEQIAKIEEVLPLGATFGAFTRDVVLNYVDPDPWRKRNVLELDVGPETIAFLDRLGELFIGVREADRFMYFLLSGMQDASPEELYELLYDDEAQMFTGHVLKRVEDELEDRREKIEALLDKQRDENGKLQSNDLETASLARQVKKPRLWHLVYPVLPE